MGGGGRPSTVKVLGYVSPARVVFRTSSLAKGMLFGNYSGGKGHAFW